MKILAISGSSRTSSTNTAMLRAIAQSAPLEHDISVFSGIADLPVFSPDLDEVPLPSAIQEFVNIVGENDALLISSPEYVRAIPGGLKNAIDWLVSSEEIINKPIALMHASHRGEDMLAQLRLVLSTVSQQFMHDLFIRFELMPLTPDQITEHMITSKNQTLVAKFLNAFTTRCGK